MRRDISSETQELPPLDPELAVLLEHFPDDPSDNQIDYDNLPVIREQAAEQAAEMNEAFLSDEPEDATMETEDITVPGPSEGQELRLRVHRPTAVDGPYPCLYLIHGGAMIMGEPERSDMKAYRFVDSLGCVVVAVEYRLAPEHPYPAAVDDCYAGLTWITDNVDELDVDDSKIAVAGGSSGGGLAAAMGLRARDEGGPELALQMLLSPMLDDRNSTESSKQVTDIGIHDRDNNVRAWDAYLGDLSGSDELPPYAAPGRVEELSGLPPVYLDVGTHDVFRDETTAYADRAAKCGVQTEYHLWPGAYHGYDSFAPDAQITEETWNTRINALRRAFDH